MSLCQLIYYVSDLLALGLDLVGRQTEICAELHSDHCEVGKKWMPIVAQSSHEPINGLFPRLLSRTQMVVHRY